MNLAISHRRTRWGRLAALAAALVALSGLIPLLSAQSASASSSNPNGPPPDCPDCQPRDPWQIPDPPDLPPVPPAPDHPTNPIDDDPPGTDSGPAEGTIDGGPPGTNGGGGTWGHSGDQQQPPIGNGSTTDPDVIWVNGRPLPAPEDGGSTPSTPPLDLNASPFSLPPSREGAEDFPPPTRVIWDKFRDALPEIPEGYPESAKQAIWEERELYICLRGGTMTHAECVQRINAFSALWFMSECMQSGIFEDCVKEYNRIYGPYPPRDRPPF